MKDDVSRAFSDLVDELEDVRAQLEEERALRVRVQGEVDAIREGLEEAGAELDAMRLERAELLEELEERRRGEPSEE